MIAWLGMTPHSPESERKRLAILAGFAFLTGTRARSQLTWRLVVALTPLDAPLRSGSGPHSGLCHCCQSQVSDAGSEWREQSGAACDCGCLFSIIITAFLGTSVIFICFTLSALYAKRRSYLFLGGEGQSRRWVSRSRLNNAESLFCAGTLMSALSLLLLLSLFNIFLGSVVLFKVPLSL